MSDLIERQAAIDVLNVGAELLKRVLDDAYVVGAEREKYEWGLGLIESYISDMRELPSAQPEQSIAEWQKDFREYMNMLNIPRDDYNGIMEYINEVPSAQPERKRGKWILKPNIYGVVYCSECDYELHTNNTNYCPDCGARMEVEHEA